MVQSRGFIGRRAAPKTALPPGQYVTEDFPVLSAGPTPHVPLEQWEFSIDDGKDVLRRWSWRAFRELPSEHIAADIHCVTRWSKLDTAWEGVSLDTLLTGSPTMQRSRSFAPLVVTRRTCRWRICWAGTRGSRSTSTARTWHLNTVVLPA